MPASAVVIDFDASYDYVEMSVAKDDEENVFGFANDTVNLVGIPYMIT